jgi:hypothetical protein
VALIGDDGAVTDDQVERAWEPVLGRLMMPRGALVTSRAAGDLQTATRTPRMGTIMTAQLVDQKEKGVAIPNADHSMKLPPGRMLSMGFELYQFLPSKLPTITRDLARITKMMVHDTATRADWDKFEGDPAYKAASAERYKTLNARVPMIKTWAKVTRPNDILDMERCESINTSARQINRHWMIQQALLLEDAQ